MGLRSTIRRWRATGHAAGLFGAACTARDEGDSARACALAKQGLDALGPSSEWPPPRFTLALELVQLLDQTADTTPETQNLVLHWVRWGLALPGIDLPTPFVATWRQWAQARVAELSRDAADVTPRRR